MTDELQRGLQRLAPGGDRAQPRAANAEQEERLRSLGYTAGSGGSGPLDDPTLPDPRTHVELYDRLQAATVAQGPALARAFEDVQQITKLDPGNPFAFGTLASMAYRHGSLSIAAQAFARALELDPDRPGVRQNYGKLLRELERYADSERELRLAVAQSDDDARTRVNLAETLVAERKTRRPRSCSTPCSRRSRRIRRRSASKGRLLLRKGARRRRCRTSRRRPRRPIPSRSSSWRARISPPAKPARRATRRARRCGGARAIRGRWPCSATALVQGRSARGRPRVPEPRVRARPAASDRCGRASPTDSTPRTTRRAPRSAASGRRR